MSDICIHNYKKCTKMKYKPFFKYGPPLVGSLFFWSPSVIYISQQQLVKITQILSDGATTEDWCFKWCLPFFLFLFLSPLLLRLLLLWLTRRVRVFPFSSALTSAKSFCQFWIEKDVWGQQDLNPQPSNLIHDELDHRTTESCYEI